MNDPQPDPVAPDLVAADQATLVPGLPSPGESPSHPGRFVVALLFVLLLAFLLIAAGGDPYGAGCGGG